MNRELQVHKLVPVIIEPDQVGLDIEAALTEEDEGVDFAVPNVTFEIRVGIEKIYDGKSDAETGAFVAKNIPVGEVDKQFDVVISATDQVGKLTVKVNIDIEKIMMAIETKRRKAEEAKAASERESEKTKPKPPTLEDRIAVLSLAEEAEERRQIKKSIEDALSLMAKFLGISDESAPEIFGLLMKHENHPSVKRGLLDMVTENCHHNSGNRHLIKYINLYINASWAKDVIAAVAMEEPKDVLLAFKDFFKQEWSKDIVMLIAEEFPDIAFENISQYEYQPWARNVAVEAAGRNPDAAIRYFGCYQDQPWAKEIIEEAAKGDPKAAFKYFDLYKNETWASAIMEEIMPKVRDIDDKEMKAKERVDALNRAQCDPHNLALNLARYMDKPWTEELIMILATQPVDGLLKTLSRYKGCSWIKAAVTTAVRCTSWHHDDLLKYYLDQPWIEEAVMLCIEKHEVVYTGWLEPCVGQPWGLRVIEKAMRHQERDLRHAFPGGVTDYDRWKKQHKDVSRRLYEQALRKHNLSG